MKQFPCPHCGERAQAEFVYERSADSVVPLDAEPAAAVAALFTRANLRGTEEEIWRHTHGCGSWLLVRRDRVSHAIEWVKPIGPEVLP
jgi:heterotetrameric sarcosine oxidase delta subunit